MPKLFLVALHLLGEPRAARDGAVGPEAGVALPRCGSTACPRRAFHRRRRRAGAGLPVLGAPGRLSDGAPAAPRWRGAGLSAERARERPPYLSGRGVTRGDAG